MEFNAIGLAALFPSVYIMFIITSIGDDFFGVQVLYQMVKMNFRAIAQHNNTTCQVREVI
jgi:hypothetical protein